MAFTTTSNFAGKAAGFYISAALKASNSLDYLTLIENVKFKSNIQAMNNTVSAVADATCDFTGAGTLALTENSIWDGTAVAGKFNGFNGAATGYLLPGVDATVVQDATCDFTGAGTLALTEKVLEPKNLQVNLDLCKSTLLDSWEALQMRAGAGAPPPASFDDYVISYMGEIIAEATENSIWDGTAVAGQFNGFNGAATGYLLPGVDATVVQDAASAAYNAGNIIANLQAAVAAIPVAALGKEDLHIYMNQRTYQYYISALSGLTGYPFQNMNDNYVPVFEGYKIAVCNGMTTNEVVIAQKSNLFFGTDLLSDATRITLMDMAALDGSDNMRLVARYSAGVQTGVGADIVRQS